MGHIDDVMWELGNEEGRLASAYLGLFLSVSSLYKFMLSRDVFICHAEEIS